MLNTRNIIINRKDDYYKLLDYIPPTHIDKEVVDEIIEMLGLICKAVVIEAPYYESDYLSSYYEFYSKKCRIFPKSVGDYSFFLILRIQI